MINRLGRFLFILLSTPLLSLGQTGAKEFKDTFIGQWKLIKKGNGTSTISLKRENPISILIIEGCVDRLEIIEFHPNVKKMRKTNPFQNIRMIEIRQDGVINDTVYPVARIHADTLIRILSFGKRDKKFYDITHITKDSIIIDRSDLYIKNTHPYSETYFSSKSDPDIQMMNKILADKKKKPTRRRKKNN